MLKLVSTEVKLDFDDVLIVPQRSTLNSRKDVILEREFEFYHSPKSWFGIPIICANMPPVSTKAMAVSLYKFKMITCLHKYFNTAEIQNILHLTSTDYSWISIGKKEDEINRLKSINSDDINICIDVPNGYLQSFVTFCAKVRNEFPNAIIMAGNVTTPEMVQELIIHGGVDIVKIQIGPGKACRTRMVTGIGYGTLSCIAECSSAAHGLTHENRRLGLVCSDGGKKHTGDICKGFAAGSDFIMLGSLFSGTNESAGNRFYGMSTHYAQEKHEGIKNDYRASEGDIIDVCDKGPVVNLLKEICGALRSCCTYIGARTLKDMNKCAKFAKVNNIHQHHTNFEQNGV